MATDTLSDRKWQEIWAEDTWVCSVSEKGDGFCHLEIKFQFWLIHLWDILTQSHLDFLVETSQFFESRTQIKNYLILYKPLFVGQTVIVDWIQVSGPLLIFFILYFKGKIWHNRIWRLLFAHVYRGNIYSLLLALLIWYIKTIQSK